MTGCTFDFEVGACLTDGCLHHAKNTAIGRRLHLPSPFFPRANMAIWNVERNNSIGLRECRTLRLRLNELPLSSNDSVFDRATEGYGFV